MVLRSIRWNDPKSIRVRRGSRVHGGQDLTAYSSCNGLTGTLTITNVSAAPEPFTWALIVENISAVALVLRYVQRRRRHASQNRRRVVAVSELT